MGGEIHKIISWSFWTANLLVDAVYVIMAWATATNLANASGNLHIATWKDTQSTVRSFVSNNIWRAPIAACALGGLMVVLFNLMSCIVLLRKSIAKKAGAGFGYGFVVGWCFVMAFFSLMCGLVMQGFTSTVEHQLTADAGWTPMMTGAFKATYIFGYIVACMFVVFFLVLVAAPSEFVDQQLLHRKRQLEMNTLSAAGGDGLSTLQAGPI